MLLLLEFNYFVEIIVYVNLMCYKLLFYPIQICLYAFVIYRNKININLFTVLTQNNYWVQSEHFLAHFSVFLFIQYQLAFNAPEQQCSFLWWY